MTSLRDSWQAGETTLGGWLSVPSSVSAEYMARTDFDYVCIDMQHGAIDYVDAVPMIQAILLGGNRPVVRVPWNEPGIIGRVLDAGAEAVIIPMVNSVEEAEAAVRACRYHPEGSRSAGPTLAGPRAEGPYHEWAADHVACIPMIESSEAVARDRRHPRRARHRRRLHRSVGPVGHPRTRPRQTMTRQTRSTTR